MGMRAHCSKDGCDYSEPSDNHRGAGLGTCPRDGARLRAHTAGRAKGRYVCPISGSVVTLGLSSTIQLDQPMRLQFQPGVAWAGLDETPVTDPGQLPANSYVRELWGRAGGRVFGPGCVIGHDYAPARPGEYQYGRADVYLAPAPDADPGTWFVNEPATFRKCAACNKRVVADDTSLMTAEWTPEREWYWAGRNNRSRRAVDTNRGPHPAGTYACQRCREGNPEPF